MGARGGVQMTWLSRLSFGQAIRWALVWPVLVVSLCVAGALSAMRERDEWAIGWNFQPAGHLNAWTALLLSTVVVLFGPPAVFLLLWKFARR